MTRTQRLARIVRTIEEQKSYISRVPDPDNRSTAETNLSILVELREQLRDELADSTDPQETTMASLAHVSV